MSLTLRLIQLDGTWREAFFAMADDYRAAGEPRYEKAVEDFDGYVTQLALSCGPDQPPGIVPGDVFFLAEGTELLGSVRLRHRLLPHLEHEGGHIGYDVRPSLRGRGYATQMLRLALDRAKARGINRVLITCNSENIASARVIEKNGGQLENQVISEQSGKSVNRYWITLS